MGENWPTDEELAEAHRRIADAEHSLEHSLLEHADALPDAEAVRRRAESISENARVHDKAADRIKGRPKSAPDQVAVKPPSGGRRGAGTGHEFDCGCRPAERARSFSDAL